MKWKWRNDRRSERNLVIAFVWTVAPVYCLLIKTFDQLKNSRHDLIFIADIYWLLQNAVIAELSRAKHHG